MGESLVWVVRGGLRLALVGKTLWHDWKLRRGDQAWVRLVVLLAFFVLLS